MSLEIKKGVDYTHEVHDKATVQESYNIFKDELQRLKELRIEIEKILAIHSLYVDEKLISQISQFCLHIRQLELTEKSNKDFDELSKKLGSEMTGVFGLKEVAEIYKSIFHLISEILNRNHFDYSITKQSDR